MTIIIMVLNINIQGLYSTLYSFAFLFQFMSGEITGLPTSSLTWIVGNLDSSFYYRVNYDEATWEELKNQLNSNHEVY